jgi:sulfonate transport system substrate-binding protein
MIASLPRRVYALLAVPVLAFAGCGGDTEAAAPAVAPTTSGPVTAASAPTPTIDPTDAAGDTGAAAGSAAGETTDPPVDLSGVTLRVGDQVSITQSGLEAAGLSDTPYTIEWSAFTSGPPLLEALAADAIDIGGVGDAPPIFAAASGAAIKVVLATKTPQANHGFLVHGDSGITDVAGLKGKKIAVAKGSAANWILLKGLDDNGLTMADVEVAYLQPSDAQQAFLSGSVDAWVVWDPFASLVEAQGAQMILTGQQLGIPGLGFQVSSDTALANPAKVAALRDYLTRVRAAQAWQREHRDEWAEKYSELTKLPIELTTKLLAVDSVPTIIDASVIDAQQAESDGFFAAGLIPTEIDFSEVVDERFNDIAGQ